MDRPIVNGVKNLCLQVFLFVSAFLLWCAPVAYAAPETLSVVYCRDLDPYQFQDSQGNAAGMAIDIWKLWSKKTGVPVTFIPATWNETLNIMREGKADAHAGLYYNEKRDVYLDYGSPYLKTDTYVFYHESLPPISNTEALLPYRIGTLEGDYAQGYLEESVPGISIVPYANFDGIVNDLKSGRLKAFASEAPSGLAALEEHGLAKQFQYRSSKPLYQKQTFVAVQQGDSKTLDLINKGMAQIAEDERTAITRKWFWGDEKGDAESLVIAIDRNYPPFYSIGTDGKPEGFFVDLWKEWARKTDTSIDFRPGDWAGTLEALNTGEADIHGGLLRSGEREQWIDFSTPFYEAAAGIFFKSGSKFTAPSDLSGEKVGAIRGSFHESFLKKEYPETEVVPFTDTDGLILGLMKGAIDAFMDDSISVDTVLGSLGLQGTIVRYPEPVFSEVYYAGVVKDRPELLKLINDGLQSFSNAELANLEARWIPREEDRYYKGANGQKTVALTEEEQRWVSSHVVKVGVENWPPIVFTGEDGKMEGIAGDYFALLTQRTGLQFEIENDNWDNLINGLRERTVDLLPDAYYTDERAEFGLFSKSYFLSKEFVYVRSDNQQVQSLDDLATKRIAVVKGYGTIPKLRKYLPEATIVETKDLLASINATLNGEVDALFEAQISMQQTLQDNGISGIKGISQSTFPASSIHVMSRIDEPLLQSIVQKGLDSISDSERREIQLKWLANATEEDNRRVELTVEEEQWVAKNPRIRVAATPDWPPFEFEQGGRHVGVAADILRLAAKRAGLKLTSEFVEWPVLMDKLKAGKLDISPGMAKTPAREKEYLFTNPFLVSRVAIWVESSRKGISSMDDLRGKTVAVENGYLTHEKVVELYPDIKLHLVKSPIDAVLAVSSGKVDAYLGNLTSTQYLSRENFITNLKVSGYFEESALNLCMGVNKEKSTLVGILNKGLASIDAKTKQDLLAQYVGSTATASARPQLVLTDEEKEWIADHKNIRLGVDPAWAPFEYLLGLTHSGLSAEYVKLLSKDTGLTFASPPVFNWVDVMRLSKEKKLDVLPAVSQTPAREQHLAFSKPYGSFPLVIFQRTNAIPLKNMGELDGKSVAVVKGYAIEQLLKDNHGDIRLVPYMNLEKAIRALSDGQVDALAGNMIAVESAKQQQSVFNIAPAIKTPYVQDLRFGVRQDWGILVRIIDKWLDTIDEGTHEHLAQVAGVDLDTVFVQEGEEEAVDFNQLLFLGGGIILVFGFSLILYLFLKRFISSKAETLYSSHQYKVVGIVVGIMFLCLIVVATWYALSQLQNRARQSVAEALESVLLSTHEAMSIWENQSRARMAELVESPVLRGSIAGLLSFPEDKAAIEASPQLWNVRKFMQDAQASRGFVEFSIVTKNYKNIATSDDEDLLDQNVISIQRPRVLDKVFLGSTIFVPPIKHESDHAGIHAKGKLTFVSIAAPIKDGDGKVIAILVLYYNANDIYQRLISLGRIGNTGETYAFDRNGNLVSENRFDEQLQSLGLVSENESGILNLRIADPGGNLAEGHALDTERVLPLTDSVKSATGGNSGRNVKGYRDYRGIPVIGAWLWDDNLGLGLVTEMDVDEALGSYRLVRNTVVGVILITILLGTLITGFSNWIGQSAAKSLSKAKDELEDRVEERTAELKKISVAVEQSPATVVITDPEGIIQYVNPTFTRITGYSFDEAVGQNPRFLNSGIHPNEFYKELWETILSGTVWNGDFLNKKKNGELFWERTSIAPIFDDTSNLTNFVAVKEDITERKAQEERFQALLDAAPDAMVIVAKSGEIALVNFATEELFGYSRDEMIGQKVEMLLPDYIRKDHPHFRDKFFATPGDMSLVAGKDFFGQTKSGDQVPVDISLNPIETEDGVQIIASIRDISERKKAEAAIAESEERTRLILSSAGEGIFGVNLKGNIVFINEAACKMVGYTEEELMGMGVHDLIHHSRSDGSFYPVDECPMRHAFVEGLTSRVDDEVLWHKDGTSFPVEYTATPVNRDSEMIGAVISFQDITERKEAEEALRRSEERFRSYFENAQVGMSVTHPDKGWLEVNPTQQKILGYSLEELRELTWSKLTHPEDLEADEKQFERMIAGEIDQYTLEKRFFRKDGEIVFTNISVACLRDDDGDVSLVLASLLDITKRKEMELDLIEAKAITEDALAVVTSSIQYASRIQRSILPPEGYVGTFTSDHFVVWEPRDVVGGDLYWSAQWGRGQFIMLGDCTGHGVPGAFMTLISTGALERSLLEVPPGDSARLISRMHQMIQEQLGQNSDANGDNGSDDGLELGVCYIHPKKKNIVFAGARMPLFVDDGENIEVVKSDKKGIGYRGIPLDFEYTNHTIEVSEKSRIFMTTDGIIDQVGGEKKRGFGKKRFIALLESLRDTPLQNQGEKIYQELLTYQGKEKRRDDVSIIGFKL